MKAMRKLSKSVKSKLDKPKSDVDSIPRLNKKSTWEDVKSYLIWLSKSPYQYHIDDDPYDIIGFTPEVSKILKENSDIMWEHSVDGSKGSNLWEVYYPVEKSKGGKLDWKEPIPLTIDYIGGRFESWYHLDGLRKPYLTGHDIDSVTHPARMSRKFSYGVLTDSAKLFSGIKSNKIDLKEFEAGGDLSIMNWKHFTIKDLEKYISDYPDVHMSIVHGRSKYVPQKANSNDSRVFSIGEQGRELTLRTGNENLLLDLIVYDEKYMENTISLYTKENKKGLKMIENEIANKFAHGGEVGDYFREFTLPSGEESSVRVKFNSFWNKWQYSVDGVIYGEFNTREDAMAEIKRDGLDKYISDDVRMKLSKIGDKIKYEGSYKGIIFEGEGKFESHDGIFDKIKQKFEAKGEMDMESLMKIRAKMLSELKKVGIDFTEKNKTMKTGGEAGNISTVIPYSEFITHTKGVIDLTKSREEHAKEMAKTYALENKKRITPKVLEYFGSGDAGAYHRVRDILETIQTTDFKDVVKVFKELYPKASKDWKSALKTGLVIKSEEKEGHYSNRPYIFNDELAIRIREAGVNFVQPIIEEILGDKKVNGKNYEQIWNEVSGVDRLKAVSSKLVEKYDLPENSSDWNYDELPGEVKESINKHIDSVFSGSSMAVGGVIGDSKAKQIIKYVLSDAKENNVSLPKLEKFISEGSKPGVLLEAWKEFTYAVNNGNNPKSLRLAYEDSNKFGDYVMSHFPNKSQREMLGYYGNALVANSFPNYAGGGSVNEKYHIEKTSDGRFGIYNKNDLRLTSFGSKEIADDFLKKANNTKEYEIWMNHPVKKSKYNVGDKIYSWQNKDYPAAIERKSFSAWTDVREPHENDTWMYIVTLKNGQRSKNMTEGSLFKTKQKEYAEGGIAPHKEVKANQAIAITEVISKFPQFKNLGAMEAGMLYNLREKEGTDEIDSSSGLKEQIYKKLEDKFYIDVDYVSYTFSLTDKAKEFIEKVNARIATRKQVKSGVDLFPETSNIPELIMASGGKFSTEDKNVKDLMKASGYVYAHPKTKEEFIKQYGFTPTAPFWRTGEREHVALTKLGREVIDAYFSRSKEMKKVSETYAEGGEVKVYEKPDGSPYVLMEEIEPIWIERNKKRAELNKIAKTAKEEYEKHNRSKRPKDTTRNIAHLNKWGDLRDAAEKAQEQAEDLNATIWAIVPRGMNVIHDKDGNVLQLMDVQTKLLDKYYDKIYENKKMASGGELFDLGVGVVASGILIKYYDKIVETIAVIREELADTGPSKESMLKDLLLGAQEKLSALVIHVPDLMHHVQSFHIIHKDGGIAGIDIEHLPALQKETKQLSDDEVVQMYPVFFEGKEIKESDITDEIRKQLAKNIFESTKQIELVEDMAKDVSESKLEAGGEIKIDENEFKKEDLKDLDVFKRKDHDYIVWFTDGKTINIHHPYGKSGNISFSKAFQNPHYISQPETEVVLHGELLSDWNKAYDVLNKIKKYAHEVTFMPSGGHLIVKAELIEDDKHIGSVKKAEIKLINPYTSKKMETGGALGEAKQVYWTLPKTTPTHSKPETKIIIERQASPRKSVHGEHYLYNVYLETPDGEKYWKQTGISKEKAEKRADDIKYTIESGYALMERTNKLYNS